MCMGKAQTNTITILFTPLIIMETTYTYSFSWRSLGTLTLFVLFTLSMVDLLRYGFGEMIYSWPIYFVTAGIMYALLYAYRANRKLFLGPTAIGFRRQIGSERRLSVEEISRVIIRDQSSLILPSSQVVTIQSDVASSLRFSLADLRGKEEFLRRLEDLAKGRFPILYQDQKGETQRRVSPK